MTCPVCHKTTGFFQEERTLPGTVITSPYPLYQYSYPGQPDYLPPRCLDCYEKIEERRKQRAQKEMLTSR